MSTSLPHLPVQLPAQLPIDPLRIVTLRDGRPRAQGRYVLYFTQVARRAEWHPGLDFAIAWANALGLPVVVYEGLRPDYPHASWRHHRFILDGVRDFAQRLAARGIAHYFYLQPHKSLPGAKPVAMVQRLAQAAALVVTDDCPTFVVPQHNARLQAALDCPLYAVDSVGVAPLRTFPKMVAAYALRPRLMRLVPGLLSQADLQLRPQHDSLTLQLDGGPELLRGTTLPEEASALDQLCAQVLLQLGVPPAPGIRGGRAAGLLRLQQFLRHGLPHYAERRNQADRDVTSNLSPYLHYGMLSAIEVARAAIATTPAGLADGNVAAFVEELVVRRELAHNFCLHTPAHHSLSALPDWAQQNLARHAQDPRPVTYDLAQLEQAATGDPLWNAIQTELVEQGEPHGYLRMLWGKKIIEWAPTYEQALTWMIYLNDKYAYDGRDANSYTGFLWCFGLHDRPFPGRPVFGVMRSMSSASTGKKAHADGYRARLIQARTHTQIANNRQLSLL